MSDEDQADEPKLSIWKYFEKIGNLKERQAACRLCKRIYCYKTTIHNLKHHLVNKHKHDIDDNPLDLRNLVNHQRCKNDNESWRGFVLWKYFTPCDDSTASCNYCGKILSYKSNKANLKSHLRRQHYDLLKSTLNDETLDEQTEELQEEYLVVEDEDPINPLSTDLSQLFERETGGHARCAICRLSLPNKEDELVAHLRSQHPNCIANGSDNEENTKNTQNDEEADSYGEVIYLDVSDRKKKIKRVYNIRDMMNAAPKPSIEQTTYSSSDEDYRPKFKKHKTAELTKHEFEVDNFLKYLSPLLREVPEEEFMKLQLDVINLVMMARMNKKLITKTGPVEKQSSQYANVSYDSASKADRTSTPVNSTDRISVPIETASAIEINDTVIQINETAVSSGARNSETVLHTMTISDENIENHDWDNGNVDETNDANNEIVDELQQESGLKYNYDEVTISETRSIK